MTSGRVLSNDEIRRIGGHASYFGGSEASDSLMDQEYQNELNLIATIQDRDKTIAELRREIVTLKTYLYGAESKYTESARQALQGGEQG